MPADEAHANGSIRIALCKGSR